MNMDKTDEDSNEETKDPAPDQSKYFCKVCSLDYPTENQFFNHKWSALHHNQMEKQYPRFFHHCLLCDFESYVIGEYLKHLIGEQHKDALKQRKENALRVERASRLKMEKTTEREIAAAKIAAERVEHKMMSRRLSERMNERRGGNSDQFSRNNWFDPHSQSMFRPPQQHGNQSRMKYNRNSYCDNYSGYQQWANHGNMMVNQWGYSNTQMHSYGQNYFSDDRIELEPYERCTMRQKERFTKVGQPPTTNTSKGVPRSSTRWDVPSSSTGLDVPKSSTSRDVPKSTTSRDVSKSSTSTNVSKSSTSRDVPKSSTSKDVPKSSTSRDVPKSSNSTDVPKSSTSTDVPKSSTSRNVPKSSSSTDVSKSSTNCNVPRSSTNRDVPRSSTSRDVPSSSTRWDVPTSSTRTDVPKSSTSSIVRRSSTKDDHSTKASGNASNNGTRLTSRLSVKEANSSVTISERNYTANNIESTVSTTKSNDVQENTFQRISTPVDTMSARSDGSVNIASTSDIHQSGQSGGDVSKDNDSDTSKESSLRDALVKHLSKSLRPNVGASRSRLHAGIRSQIENTEKPLHQKLVQILSSSKYKHMRETEMAKLKKISGLQKRLCKGYDLPFRSSDGQTDDLQEYNRLFKNLRDCNFADMAIHDDPELMAQLKAVRMDGQETSSDDINSAIPTSSSSTGVVIKQEPMEPLQDQVCRPTNVFENQPHNVLRHRYEDSGICFQPDVSLIHNVHNRIKEEPLDYDEVVDTTSDLATFLRQSAKHNSKQATALTNEMEVRSGGINQPAQNTTSVDKADNYQLSLNNSETKCEKSKKRKENNGHNLFQREGNSSDTVVIQRDNLVEFGVETVLLKVVQEEQDEVLPAVLDGSTSKPKRKKCNKQKFQSEAFSSGIPAKDSQISLDSGETGSPDDDEKPGTSYQTSPKHSEMPPPPPANKPLDSSGDMPTSGMKNNLQKLFDISVREESLHHELKEIEIDIHELKDVIQRKLMALNKMQSAKEQLDKELKSLRGMRMQILEGARQGEEVCSTLMPNFPGDVPSTETQKTVDLLKHPNQDQEVGTTSLESQVEKACSSTHKVESQESQPVATVTSASNPAITAYPPAIVLSTGDQNVDMRTVMSLLANPNIMLQIQRNFSQLNQAQMKPDKDTLIVTLPDTDNMTDIPTKDPTMEEVVEEDPVAEGHEVQKNKSKRKSKDDIEMTPKRQSKRIKTSKTSPTNPLMEVDSEESTSKKISYNAQNIHDEDSTQHEKKSKKKKVSKVSKQSILPSNKSSRKQAAKSSSQASSSKQSMLPSNRSSRKQPAKSSSQASSKETPLSDAEEMPTVDLGDSNVCNESNVKLTRLSNDSPEEGAMRFIDCEEDLLNMAVTGGILYCTCKDNSVRAYNLQSCQLEGTYTASNSKILCMAVVKKRLFISYADEKLCEFDLETQKPVHEYHCSGVVTCMHSNKNSLYIGMSNGIVALVNSTKHELKIKYEDSSSVTCITTALRQKTKVLITASETITIIDERTGTLLTTIDRSVKDSIIYMNVFKEMLYTATASGLLHVNSMMGGKRVRVAALDSSFSSFQMVDQSIITANERRSAIKISDIKTLKVKTRFSIEGEAIRCALVHDQKMILGGMHGLICIYDPADHFLFGPDLRCRWNKCGLTLMTYEKLVDHFEKHFTNETSCKWMMCRAYNRCKVGQKPVKVHVRRHLKGFRKTKLFYLCKE